MRRSPRPGSAIDGAVLPKASRLGTASARAGPAAPITASPLHRHAPRRRGPSVRAEDVELMLAATGAAFSREGWIFELKYDGYRLLAEKHKGAVRLLTRNLADATGWFPDVAAAVRDLPGDFLLDGEVCVLDARGVPDFERLRRRAALRRYRPGGDLALYFAFDALAIAGRDLRALPLIERKACLRRLIPENHPVHYVEHIHNEGLRLYEGAVSLGMEGIVAKRASAPYVGGRSGDWIKSKPAGIHDGWKRPRRSSLVVVPPPP